MIYKSEFFRGTHCSKAWWLFQERTELKASRSDERDVFQLAAIETTKKARELYPQGIKVSGTTQQKIEQTLHAVQNKTSIIFNAHFQWEEVLVTVDILILEKNSWSFLLVKSAAKKKRKHLRDAALQWNVLKAKGLSLNTVCLLHINTSYVLEKKLDLNQFFTRLDMTAAVLDLQPELDRQFDSLSTALAGNTPEIEIGAHCLQPHECEFKNHCWSNLPELPIFNLTRLATSKKVELFEKGIFQSKDLPEDYPLTDAQKIQIHAEKTNSQFINKPEIEKFLKKLKFPLCFLDFEALQPVAPRFPGDAPFEFIPIQYSLHQIKTEEASLEHTEFLTEDDNDPRLEFATSLIKSIPPNACILVYNASLEKKILESLAIRFPKLEKSLMDIAHQLTDLIEPFHNKHIYDPKMKGKSSIKSVLPALIPEMEKSYQNLNIKNGMMAMGAYFKFMSNQNFEERQKIRQDLLNYCKLDTLAMVKLWEFLNNLLPRELPKKQIKSELPNSNSH
jgi:hypothetical protein